MQKIWIVLLTFIGFSVYATPFTGTLYEKGSERKVPLYKFSCSGEDDPNRHIHSVYSDLNGAEVVVEDTWFENNRVKKYVLDHKQTGDHGILEINGDKAHMEYTRKGKTSKADLSFDTTGIVAPSTVPFLRAHWAELIKGDKIKAKFYVLDRLDWYTFEFSKIKEETVNGQKIATIKMRPANFAIAALVDPLYFKFAYDGSRLLSFDGRVLPKKKDGSSWKDLDAETVYAY